MSYGSEENKKKTVMESSGAWKLCLEWIIRTMDCCLIWKGRNCVLWNYLIFDCKIIGNPVRGGLLRPPSLSSLERVWEGERESEVGERKGKMNVLRSNAGTPHTVLRPQIFYREEQSWISVRLFSLPQTPNKEETIPLRLHP